MVTKTRSMTVTCPICGDVIDIPEYDSVTRTDALKQHIKLMHGYGEGNPIGRTGIEQIAARTADKVMEQIRYGGSEEAMSAAKDSVLGQGGVCAT